MRYPGASAFVLASLLIGSQAYAQTAPDYNKPDVEVNRSVLRELKGYNPPPMFGGAAPTDATVTNESTQVTKPLTLDVPAPDRPSLTAPKAEDLLGHPVENFHVLTEQKGSLTVPDPGPDIPAAADKSDELPVPVKKADKPADKPKVKPPASLVDAKKEEPKKAEKKPEPKKVEPVKAEKPKPVPAPEVKSEAPKIVPKLYQPKTAKTMPAVPPVKVDKTPLAPPPGMAALPPIEPPMAKAKPSIGDRIIDQSLKSRIEEDTEKIHESLKIDTPAAPVTDVDQMSFEFASGKVDLTKDIKAQIKSSILPPLKSKSSLRVSIMAFASGGKGESAARRESLSRALAMRQFFIDNDIPAARMDLKALGDKTSQTPADRVDLVLIGK